MKRIKGQLIAIVMCIGIVVFVIVTGGVHAEKPDAQADLLKRQQESNPAVEIEDISRVEAYIDEESTEDTTVSWVDSVLERMAAEETEEVYTDPISEVEDESPAVFDSDHSAADHSEDSNEVVYEGEYYDADPGNNNDDAYCIDNSWDELPAYDVSTDLHLTDDDIWNMARIVWLEVGICGCSYRTQYLTACVLVNRLLDWGYGSMTEVIYAPGQYATADQYVDWGGSSLNIGSTTWQAVYDAIADPDRNPHYQMSKGHDHQVYYSDPDWDVCFYY